MVPMTSSPPVPQQIIDGIWPRCNERGYSIYEQPARTPKPKKIICIGAGISGITLAYKVKTTAPQFQIKVYDNADKPGGNWHWNKYPGVACDNAGVTYQYIGSKKADWPNFYSKGDDIVKYFQDFVKENALEDYMRLNTQVTKAEWSDETSLWTVSLQDVKSGETWTDTANVLISATGSLHHPKWPTLKGMEKFKGALIHAARYPENLDLKNKRVAVLGTGSTGVQIIPAILKDAGKIYHWIRQATFVIPQDGAKTNFPYTKEQQLHFAKDPKYYLAYRKALESSANYFFKATLKGSKESIDMTAACTASMKAKLATRPDIAEKLIPKTFSVGCRRPTPAPGYLEAICDDKVTVFLEELGEMTEKGFIDAAGTEHEVDVFICATGYDTSYIPKFPVISRGENLQDRWAEGDPDSYLSIAIPNYPNYFTSYGPWGPTAHGSAVPVIEILADTFLGFTRKMSEEHILSMEPTEAAVADFMEHCALYLQRTVFSEGCSSWWKRGPGALPRVFPGTRVSFIDAVSRFRAEDWAYRYEGGNRFRHWGNGFNKKEVDGSDDTWYLGALDNSGRKPVYGSIIAENSPHVVTAAAAAGHGIAATVIGS